MKLMFLSIIPILYILSGCAGPSDFEVKINDDFEVVRTSPDIVQLYRDDEEVIDVQITSKITHLNWNNDYLIAKQNVYDDEINELSDKIQFWIVNLKSKEVIGPLSKEEFENQTKLLGISLKLKKVSKFT